MHGELYIFIFIISIVNEFNQIIGIGYNGFPRGCSDDVLRWAREADNELDTKYMYVCHAEMNAILNMNSANARGCKVCLFLLFLFIVICYTLSL